jgi:hypothetical protein
MVIVDVPEPGAGRDVKLAVTPDGRPLAVKLIAALKPPETTLVTGNVPLAPAMMPG